MHPLGAGQGHVRGHGGERARRALSATLTAVAASLATVGAAHADEVRVTLNGLDAVTEILLPTFVEYDCYGQDRDLLYAVAPDAIAERACYTKQLAGAFMMDEPDSDCVLVVNPDEFPYIDWECATEGGRVEWTERVNCRDWQAAYALTTYVPLDSRSVTAQFGNGGALTTELDLDEAEVDVSLLLVGERVDSTGCTLQHLTNPTMTYGIDIHAERPSGSLQSVLAADTELGAVFIERIPRDSIDLELPRGSVSFDTMTNNQIDTALIVLASRLPGAGPLIALVGAVAKIAGIDVVSVRLITDLAFEIYDRTSPDVDCQGTDDCVATIAEGVLGDQSKEILREVNDVLERALALQLAENVNGQTTLLGAPFGYAVGLDSEATLTGFSTSAAANTGTAFWDVAVSAMTPGSGTCAAGLGAAVFPPIGSVTPVSGDLSLTASFELIANAAHAVIQQLSFCNVPLLYAGFTTQLSMNGGPSVAAPVAQRIDLSLPLSAAVTDPFLGSTQTLTFNARLRTLPSVAANGDLTLVLDSLTLTGMSGTLPAVVTTFIQTQLNATLAPFFPLPIVQRFSPYVVRHVYLHPRSTRVDAGSVSVGVAILDGTPLTDLAVVALEGTASYTDRRAGNRWVRTQPARLVIENVHAWNESPPADLEIQLEGATTQRVWLPPLEPGERYLHDFDLELAVTSTGNVVGSPDLTVSVDPSERTIRDEHRGDNVLELEIDGSFFAVDYAVELGDVSGVFAQSGLTVGPLTQARTGASPTSAAGSSVDPAAARFSVPVTVRNVGTRDGTSNTLSFLRAYVNGDLVASRTVAGMSVGGSVSTTFELDVSDGPELERPTYTSCVYEVHVEIEVADRDPYNDGDSHSFRFDRSVCDSRDERPLDAADPLDRFDDLDSGTLSEDRGTADLNHGNGAPILDRVDPLP